MLRTRPYRSTEIIGMPSPYEKYVTPARRLVSLFGWVGFSSAILYVVGELSANDSVKISAYYAVIFAMACCSLFQLSWLCFKALSHCSGSQRILEDYQLIEVTETQGCLVCDSPFDDSEDACSVCGWTWNQEVSPSDTREPIRGDGRRL